MRLSVALISIACLTAALLVLSIPPSFSQSTENTGVSVTILDAGEEEPPGGGGGGGGGIRPPATVIFKGYAYPGALVTFLSGGVVIGTAVADGDGSFDKQVQVSSGLRTLGVWAKDSRGLSSSVSKIQIKLRVDSVVEISQLLLSPTISIGFKSVLPGSKIQMYGTALPGTRLRIYNTKEDSPLAEQLVGAGSGGWSYVLDTSEMNEGNYEFRATSELIEDGIISPLSIPIGLLISDEEILACGARGDYNSDGKTNIVDLSILLAHWGDNYNRVEYRNECVDSNRDGEVDIFDLSILMSEWTG